MTEPMGYAPPAIKEGDRVYWRSTRRNHKGSSHRVGTVVEVYDRYAFVNPDKGQGRYQPIVLGRLRKIEEKQP